MESRKLRIGSSLTVLALWSVPAGGCLASSSSADAGGGDDSGSGSGSSSGSASSSSGAGASSSGGSSSSGGGGDATGSSSGSSSGGGTALTPDPTGYVSVTALGIQGAWYGYGDCWGTNGAPPGNCETAGSHPTSACSSITFPVPPSASDAGEGGAIAVFTQTTPGTMCLTGTAAKVIGTPPDYSNIFGIGIGLDFNNVGGVKMPYNAPTNKVTGLSFTVTGVPSGGIRVELPTTDTTATGSDSYAITVTKDGSYTADLMSGTAAPALSPSFAASGFTEPAFKAADLLSIQFHVATNVSAAIPVTNLCVSNLMAIVSP